MEEEEFELKDVLARLAADEEQNLAQLTSMGRQIGILYKSLRRNGLPRRLAMDITHEFFHSIMGMTTLQSLLNEVTDDNDD